MKSIQLTDEQYEFLMNLSKEMNTQDNLATADPLYCVYDKEDVPTSSDYSSKYVWLSYDCDYHIEGEDKKSIEEKIKEYKEDNPEEDMSNMDEDEAMEHMQFKKCYCIEKDIFKENAFLTMKAAKRFIELNHYHYKKPYVYVISAWRNNEMQTIMGLIKNLTKEAKSDGRKAD